MKHTVVIELLCFYFFLYKRRKKCITKFYLHIYECYNISVYKYKIFYKILTYTPKSHRKMQ